MESLGFILFSEIALEACFYASVKNPVLLLISRDGPLSHVNWYKGPEVFKPFSTYFDVSLTIG